MAFQGRGSMRDSALSGFRMYVLPKPCELECDDAAGEALQGHPCRSCLLVYSSTIVIPPKRINFEREKEATPSTLLEA